MAQVEAGGPGEDWGPHDEQAPHNWPDSGLPARVEAPGLGAGFRHWKNKGQRTKALAGGFSHGGCNIKLRKLCRCEGMCGFLRPGVFWLGWGGGCNL